MKRQEAEQPLEMPINTTPCHETPKLLNEELLRGVPDAKKQAAEALLTFLRQTPSIQWTERKELLLKGQPLAGSNLLDLFHHAVRDKSMNTKPTGWDEFLGALQQNNVPRLALGNKNIHRPPPQNVGTQAGVATTSAASRTPIPAIPPYLRSRTVTASPKKQSGKGRGFKFVSMQ